MRRITHSNNSTSINTNIYIGTSGWHYNHWVGLFYPSEIKGYNELRYHSKYFNSVENNSSFYRIAKESTYKTWFRMTPEHYRFSMKLNKLITHIHKLELCDEVVTAVHNILTSTQTLKNKLGAIVIQLSPGFKLDIDKLEKFLAFFTAEVLKNEYHFDIAIEFRNKYWLVNEVYEILKSNNVALVASQSSRYPETRLITASFAYIRMHGPEKLFASKYSAAQLEEWAAYIRNISREVNRIYVYFNNDFYGYALENAKALMSLLA